MTTADEPPARPGVQETADAPGPMALMAVTHPEALAGIGLRGALFAHWGRQKRRNALQQRYGEEAGALLDDGETAFEYSPGE